MSEATSYVGYTLLDMAQEVSKVDRIRDLMVHDTPWDRLFDLASQPLFRELVIDALASYSTGGDGRPDHPLVQVIFRLAHKTYQMFPCHFV
ncbi:hypothetical protein Hanom_Chr09g00774071 [Helianthus anomalus]